MGPYSSLPPACLGYCLPMESPLVLPCAASPVCLGCGLPTWCTVWLPSCWPCCLLHLVPVGLSVCQLDSLHACLLDAACWTLPGCLLGCLPVGCSRAVASIVSTCLPVELFVLCFALCIILPHCGFLAVSWGVLPGFRGPVHHVSSVIGIVVPYCHGKMPVLLWMTLLIPWHPGALHCCHVLFLDILFPDVQLLKCHSIWTS